MAEKTRYSDEELEEFRAIINDKLALARRDYEQMMSVLMNQDGNDVDDTSPTYKILEEGSAPQTKEELIQLPAGSRSSYRAWRQRLYVLKTRLTVSTGLQASSSPRNACVLCPMQHLVSSRSRTVRNE